MKLSVIMSVYNGEKDINNAIKSILNQSYKDFEFIIIDDGSRDLTYEILKSYKNKDKRIKILRNTQNIGLTKSLNNAIMQSRGEFIARHDVDDISLPQRFEKQMDFLHKNKDYAICGCNGIIKQTKKELLEFFDYQEIKENLIVKNCFFHPSIIFKKKAIEKHGLYNEKYLYGQDYELWCRLIYKNNLKAKNLKEKLIIANIPLNKLLEKNKYKILIQMKNDLITKVKYFKYSKSKLRGVISILSLFIKIFYIILFSKH